MPLRVAVLNPGYIGHAGDPDSIQSTRRHMNKFNQECSLALLPSDTSWAEHMGITLLHSIK